jgi:integrase/recombinase XerD
MQTLLLVLYGTGMRIGEALSLTLQDIDLGNCVLTVRDTKFFKTRLVPIGPRLTMVLRDYLSLRYRLPLPDGAGSAFLATRSGIRMDYRRVNKLFCRLRRRAGMRLMSNFKWRLTEL